MTTNATRHNPAAADLRVIASHWGNLHAMLTVPATADWPPAARMADHQAQLTDDEQAELEAAAAAAAAEWAERTPIAMGERPVPLRLAILDTIRIVEAALIDLADQVAGNIQRPAATVRRSASPGDTVGQALRLAATQDEADSRRWHYAGGPAADKTRPQVRHAGRTAPQAITWLLARVDAEPGPFRELRPIELDRLASATRAIRGTVERALRLGRRTDPIPRPCPCGGRMVIHHGGALTLDAARRSTWGSVLDPEVECQDCGMRWVGAAMAALVQMDEAA